MSATMRRIVVEVLSEIAPEAILDNISASEDFREELDLDSMDFLDFLAGLSERLSIEIPEADYPKIDTLDHLLAYLDERAG